MSKELTTEEYYNKLWLENKELIQENIERLDKKRFALQLMLAEKDKEIERLNNLLKETSQTLSEQTTKAITLKSENERLNNIINTILDFNLFAEECPLNFGYTEKCNEEKAQDVFYEDDYCEKTCNDNYKKCWLKYFKRLQELKGVDKE